MRSRLPQHEHEYGISVSALGLLKIAFSALIRIKFWSALEATRLRSIARQKR
jgi:hypothetical protein